MPSLKLCGVVTYFPGIQDTFRIMSILCPIDVVDHRYEYNYFRKLLWIYQSSFQIFFVSGAGSAIRPGPLQRARALGLWHQLLAMDVVDADSLDDEAVGEERTEGKRTNGTSNIDFEERDGDGCENYADFWTWAMRSTHEWTCETTVLHGAQRESVLCTRQGRCSVYRNTCHDMGFRKRSRTSIFPGFEERLFSNRRPCRVGFCTASQMSHDIGSKLFHTFVWAVFYWPALRSSKRFLASCFQVLLSEEIPRVALLPFVNLSASCCPQWSRLVLFLVLSMRTDDTNSQLWDRRCGSGWWGTRKSEVTEKERRGCWASTWQDKVQHGMRVRMTMTFYTRRTIILSHGRCAWVRKCGVQRRREKCAGERSRKCFLCTHAVAFSDWRLTGREKLLKTWIRKAIRAGGSCWRVFFEIETASSFLVPVNSNFLLSTSQLFPIFCPCIIIPIVLIPSLPIRRPRLWGSPGCWRPMERGRWGWLFAFFCKILSTMNAQPLKISL